MDEAVWRALASVIDDWLIALELRIYSLALAATDFGALQPDRTGLNESS